MLETPDRVMMIVDVEDESSVETVAEDVELTTYALVADEVTSVLCIKVLDRFVNGTV
jgi:hypothetical protein